MKNIIKNAKISLTIMTTAAALSVPLVINYSTPASASSRSTLSWTQWKKEMIPLMRKYYSEISTVENYYNHFNQNLWGVDLQFLGVTKKIKNLESPDPVLNRLVKNWMWASYRFGADVALSFVGKSDFGQVDYFWNLTQHNSNLADKRLKYDINH